MTRVPLNKFSANLPPLPITPSELQDIWNAVAEYPITGNQVLDFRLLVLTGLLESAFRSPRIMPPNGESSALGYFQIIRAVRNTLSKRLGIPWDDSVATQAKFAAAGYSELARFVRKGKVKRFAFSSDPLTNLLLNTRFRYIVGTGSKYLGHRDALSFGKKTRRYMKFLAQGDQSRVVFMHPVLKDEFSELPVSVKDTFNAIVDSMLDANVFVSSVLSSFTGQKRDRRTSPNHADFKAIDFVLTPFDSPFFLDQTGAKRSPNYHWNKYLIEHLVGLYDDGLLKASVLIEPDHIHIDSNHPTGVSIKDGDKPIYKNLASGTHNITITHVCGHFN